MDDLIIRDDRLGQELHFKRDKEGDVKSVEIFFDQPRPLVMFINYQALQIPTRRPGPAIPGNADGPRPCGQRGS